MLYRMAKAKRLSKKENHPIRPKDLFGLKGFMVPGTDNRCYKDELEELWGIRPMEILPDGTFPDRNGELDAERDVFLPGQLFL